MTTPLQCPICEKKSTLKCGGCKNVVYCGKDHQKEHWKKGHKLQCKCFEIVTNEQFGRHMRATRDIKKGEVILREHAIIVGPKTASYPMCLGCHKNLIIKPGEKDFYKCSKCTWPMCGYDCEKLNMHKAECELMSSSKFVCNIKYTNEMKKESAYCVIVPLRCMLLRTTKPEMFAKLMELEDHLDERMKTTIYKVLKANLITFIQTILKIRDIDEKDILRIAAILDTNAFEIRNNSAKTRALFPVAAMISHDCIPNTRHLFNDNQQLLFIATMDIAKGDLVTTTYTQPLKSTLMRREHLQLSKCFECNCRRCIDPTELDTFIGAIICSHCKIGKIISTDPLNNGAVWKCQICSHEISAKQISWGNAAVQKDIENLDKTNPREFEEFILKYETLHEKNTHILQVKYALIQLYGNIPGFMLHELTDAGVERKINLCWELLEIANLFEPGWSRFRGTLLLDLQEILTVQAKREFEKQLITKEATAEKLMESMKYLEEAMKILIIEPGMKEVLEQRMSTLIKEIEMD